MKPVVFVQDQADIQGVAESLAGAEVLIEPALTARCGRLSLSEVKSLHEAALKTGLKPVLVWDTLVNQNSFGDVTTLLREVLDLQWKAVRVRDIGAASWIADNFSSHKLQLLCEEGSHNLESLRGWCECFGDSLERIVLSIELVEEKLCAYAKALPVETEILGAGRIQLFYSPRKLLRRNFKNAGTEQIPFREVVSASDDSHARPFPTVETMHGTMMFLDKDQFILDKLSNLVDAGMSCVRIDLKHFESAERTSLLKQLAASWSSLSPEQGSLLPRKQWPHKTLAPFFRNNNTTKQFKRLRSPLHAQRDERCLAQVITVQKGKFVLLQALRDFSVADAENFVTSAGSTIKAASTEARTLDGVGVQKVKEGGVFTFPYTKGVANSSLLIAGGQAS